MLKVLRFCQVAMAALTVLLVLFAMPGLAVADRLLAGPPGPVPNIRVTVPDPDQGPDPRPGRVPDPIVVPWSEASLMGACDDSVDCATALRSWCILDDKGKSHGTGTKRVYFDKTSDEKCHGECEDSTPVRVECLEPKPPPPLPKPKPQAGL